MCNDFFPNINKSEGKAWSLCKTQNTLGTICFYWFSGAFTEHKVQYKKNILLKYIHRHVLFISELQKNNRRSFQSAACWLPLLCGTCGSSYCEMQWGLFSIWSKHQIFYLPFYSLRWNESSKATGGSYRAYKPFLGQLFGLKVHVLMLC